MSTVVTKFGGSSLADASQFKKVKNIICADEARKYVIPSAPGKRNKKDTKVTDLLYLCHAHVETGIDLDDVFKHVESRYTEIVNELGLNFDIKKHLEVVKKDLEDGASKDYAASRGEYLNGLVLAEYLGYEFVDAKDVIVFDEDGALNSEKTNEALKAVLSKTPKAVIPGFYGADTNGNIVTFSRGGSDVTGALVAASVNADLYENWTDVSGFLMADPRIIDNPKAIDQITYKELRELSYMGASVLHEDAIFPVRAAGIPINIKNTNRPEDKGTFIVQDMDDKECKTITGIAGKKDFTVISIEKAMMNSEIGFGRKVLQAFEENNISFEHMPSGIDTMTIVVHADEFIDKEQSVVSAIHRLAEPDSVEIESGLALIAVVGRGMKSASGTAGKLFTALANKGINIKMIDQGSSELNIIIGVENRDFETAIKAIYSTFITK